MFIKFVDPFASLFVNRLSAGVGRVGRSAQLFEIVVAIRLRAGRSRRNSFSLCIYEEGGKEEEEDVAHFFHMLEGPAFLIGLS